VVNSFFFCPFSGAAGRWLAVSCGNPFIPPSQPAGFFCEVGGLAMRHSFAYDLSAAEIEPDRAVDGHAIRVAYGQPFCASDG
jgi:hypothetical protein